MHQGPFYDPPYDSPIEDMFAYHFVKYVRRDASFTKQEDVQTPGGLFIIDFLVQVDTWKVGIECDGAEFHEDPFRDSARDALIISTGFCNTIYRVGGRAIKRHIEDMLFFMARLDPQLFSERGRAQLPLLASETAREFDASGTLQDPGYPIWLQYPEAPLAPIGLERRPYLRSMPPGLKRFLALVEELGPMPLDELLEIDVARSKEWAKDIDTDLDE